MANNEEWQANEARSWKDSWTAASARSDALQRRLDEAVRLLERWHTVSEVKPQDIARKLDADTTSFLAKVRP